MPFSIAVSSGAGYNHSIPFRLSISANGGAYTATVVFTVTTSSSVEPFSGTILTDTVWSGDKTYLINGNVAIAPGVRLIIEQGTVVKFDGNYAFGVWGTLVANGTEAQPVVFMPASTGIWNRIYFDDSSEDAVVDGHGVYQSGTMLRNVRVQGAANGLVCNGATPYLIGLVTNAVAITRTLGSGITCTLGSTDFWLVDSSVSGDVSIDGRGKVVGSRIVGGSLNLGGSSELRTSTVGASASLGSGSVVEAVAAGGDITIQGVGTVASSTVASGKITLDSGFVVSNAVRGGGISVGSGSMVSGNSVENAGGVGIQTSGVVTVTANRVVGSVSSGVVVSAGLVLGNLIANSSGDGLRVGSATVVSNTFTGNLGRALYTAGGVPVRISGNNFEANRGSYDLYNDNPAGQFVNGQRNWWGTTSTSSIVARIYDFNDGDLTRGVVNYAPVLSSPAVDAPAYTRGITLTPASPVGIQTVAFDAEFSRPMDGSVNPTMLFYESARGTWRTLTRSNSGLPGNSVRSSAVDRDGAKWFGTQGGGVARFDGASWTTYSRSNSPLPNDDVSAIAVDANGAKWFGTWGGGVARFDGANWTTYHSGNSLLPDNTIRAIAIDLDGSAWFSTWGGGVARFDGVNWTVYNTANSGLPDNAVWSIAVDHSGVKWFGTVTAGVASFDGTIWRVYDGLNSGLASSNVFAIAIDLDGSKWFATGYSGTAVHFDGTNWTVYRSPSLQLPWSMVSSIAFDRDGAKWVGSTGGGAARFDGVNWTAFGVYNSGLPSNDVYTIAIDPDGNRWFGTFVYAWGPGQGLGVLARDGLDYPISQNAQWPSPTRYRATYDISTLVARGTYSLTVSAAVGADGIGIVPFMGPTFTVDYAGYIADTTPPSAPTVQAWGDGTTTALQARWSASDAQSSINLYRYAIGTTPGGADVVNWTNIGAAQLSRSGLALQRGRAYYVSIKARNEAGLWSQAGISNAVVAGVFYRLYLPMITLNY